MNNYKRYYIGKKEVEPHIISKFSTILIFASTFEDVNVHGIYRYVEEREDNNEPDDIKLLRKELQELLSNIQ